MNLNNAKVLITGGNSGIGRATAELLISKGAQVFICGRNETTVESTKEELGCFGMKGDVGNETEVIDVVKTANKQMGGIDVLLNNAGFGTFSPLHEIDTEEFESVFRTNVTGAMMVAREVAKIFKEQQSGNIINIASTAGQKGFAGGSAYVASKFALRGMTECWRAELRPFNVRVMLVNPSEVVTSFFEQAGLAQTVNETKLQASDLAHLMVSMLELPDRGFITDTTIWATNPK